MCLNANSCSKRLQSSKTDFLLACLQIRDVVLVDARFFCKVDLPPPALLAQLAYPFAQEQRRCRLPSTLWWE